MRQLWHGSRWILATLFGSAVFSAGFSLFLVPHGINPGGATGLSTVLVELIGWGTVGFWSVVINLPLFALAGRKVGRKFFFGSLVGMVVSSVLIDAFAMLPFPHPDRLMSTLYGGVICGLGMGVVYVAGASTGGMDIVVRLVKLRYRNVPLGQISMATDAVVVLLTGIVFGDMGKALYTGVVVFICGQVMDAVIYRFDYSKVALIISPEYEAIAETIGQKLDRGATFLHAEGTYTHQPTKVVLAAVKKQQVAELKELVMELDPEAFVIVQEAHQVLGDGFSRYSRNAI